MKNLIYDIKNYSGDLSAEYEEWHHHNGYELIFVLNGFVNIQINDYIHEIYAPSVIMLNPFEKHKIIKSGNNYNRCILMLNSDKLEEYIHPRLISMMKCRPSGFKHGISLDSNTTQSIKTELENINNELNNDFPMSNIYLQNSIYNLLIMLYRLNENKNNLNHRMIQVQSFIDDNYADIKSIQDIAEKFFISHAHLSRSFKSYTGYTLVEYLKNTRLYHAQLLLINSSLRINEICKQVGFSDTNNFTKQFTHAFGISPLNFRIKNQISK